LTDFKAAVVVLVKGHLGEVRAHSSGVSGVHDSSSGNFPHAVKTMASTMFAYDAPFVYASNTSVTISHVLFVLYYCKRGNWQQVFTRRIPSLLLKLLTQRDRGCF